MDNTAFVLGIIFVFVLGAGVGFYLSRLLF